MGEINIFNLEDLINQYKLTTFVETGTGEGYGLSHASKYDFQDLYSIEIIPDLYKKGIVKFKDNSRVHLLNADSIAGLNSILVNDVYNRRYMFWLDAHFPGADFHIDGYSYHDDIDKSIKLPLEEELKLILSHRPNNKDVFIIDDLNLYEDGFYECGNIREDLKYLRQKYNLNGLDFITNLFSSTHKLKKVNRHQGFIFLLPKEL